MQKRNNWKTKQVFSLILLISTMLLSCSERVDTEIQEPKPVVKEEPEPIGLAFSSVSSSIARTRLDAGIVQDPGLYRQIGDFRLLGLVKEGSTIKSVTDAVIGYPYDPEDKTNARYYHFGYCDLPIDDNGCLVYAKAKDSSKDGVPKSVYNGNLYLRIPDYVMYTSDIYAEPVSIISDATVGEDGIPADAWTLANALTNIANIENWSTMNDNNLKPLLAHFTNYGYDLPGSAACVRAWIGAVKKAAEDLGSLGDGQVEELVRLDIISKANDYLNPEKEGNIAGLNYPQDINLPDGSAVLRWTEVEGEGGTKVKKFVPQLRTTTLDDINSISYFVYPAALYYFVESGIWTSNSKVTFEEYKGRSPWEGDENTWTGDDDGTVQWLFKAGDTVTGSTKTVAIAKPLQYAVARLQLTVEVKDDVDVLTYNGTNTIPYKVDDKYQFRLTGVIVGGQRKVGYDFKPIALSEDDERFVYDSQVGNTY